MQKTNSSLFAAAAGEGESVKELFCALPEESQLPQKRIYNSLSDELLASLADTKGWHLVVDEGGAASSVIKDGVLTIGVADGGRCWYAIQVCYLALPIEVGYYTVSFEARSESPRKMILDIAHVGDDWFAFAGRLVFKLTPEWTRHEFTFYNDNRIEPMARFEFNLGGESVGAQFSKVRIGKES